MKVKITRTIDIEDVPEQVNQIVSECRRILHEASNMLRTKMYDVPGMIDGFNKTSELLNMVEIKLQDASNISIGWNQVFNPHEEETLPQEESNEEI